METPASVASEPKTTSSMPSMPAPESAMLATFAMTHPKARPGTASAVSNASTQAASEILNWMGPQASPPKNSSATNVRVA